MLDFIWTKIKRDKRKRLLIIDEAWIMMQHEDAARFVYSIAKRARKYALGLTTITQDVDDFLNSDYGKAIINNSSLQILLKQSPAAIDKLKKVFYLTDGEKSFLMSAGIGQGIFFAGANHVAIEVVASENEYNLITTNPNEIVQQQVENSGGDQLDINAKPLT
jgi:type IV secretory pathway VirB4 component